MSAEPCRRRRMGPTCWRSDRTPIINNLIGIVHGGVSSTGLELVASAAINHRQAEPLRTASIRVNFLRPFFAGERSRYEGTAVRVGRNSAIGDARAVERRRQGRHHGPHHGIPVNDVTDDFAALCANEPELATLRASVREFLAADRVEFGWEPAVDAWLSSWDDQFSARLADAGFLGLTIPREYGGHGLQPSAPLRGNRGVAGRRRAGGRALDRRPPGRSRPVGLRLRGATAAAAAENRCGAVLLGDRDERAAGRVRPCGSRREGHPHRGRLAAVGHQGVDQRRASGAPDRRAGPHQPRRPRPAPCRIQPVHRAHRLGGHHDQPDRADVRRTPFQRGDLRRGLHRRQPTCSARSAPAGTRSPRNCPSSAAAPSGS